MKIPSNTSYFEYYNANPKNKHTTDCVIRAICTALNQTYEQTLRELTELQIKTGYDMSEVKCYGKYLESKGWMKKSSQEKVTTPNTQERNFAQLSIKKFWRWAIVL